MTTSDQRVALEALASQFGLKVVDDEESASTESKTTTGAATPNTDSEEKEKTEASKPEEDPALKDAEVGSVSNVKSLYKGPADSEGNSQWLDKYPEDAEPAAETKETAKYALIARKRKCYTGRAQFDVDSIIVNSPALKKVLGRVFANYPGITCELDRLEFHAPFSPFVHRWTEFTEAMNSTRDGKTKEHLVLLHSILKEELKDTIKALEDYVVHGVTTYKHLWAIFQPGCIVYSGKSGTPKAMSFYSGNYAKNDCGEHFSLCLEPVGWTGSSFGRGTEYICVYSFAGTRPIESLTALPLSFHPDQKKIRETLITRGKKYEALAGFHYKSYNGVALSWNSQGKLVPLTVRSSHRK